MATNSPLILDKPEDWPNWIDDIQGLIPQNIWKLVDPDAETHENILEEPELPEARDVNESKTTYPELSATERTVYDQMFKYYQAALERYKRQDKGLQEARTLIKTRISSTKSVKRNPKGVVSDTQKGYKSVGRVHHATDSQQISRGHSQNPYNRVNRSLVGRMGKGHGGRNKVQHTRNHGWKMAQRSCYRYEST